MEDFLELAKYNTKKDLETCGVLGAFLVRMTCYFRIHVTLRFAVLVHNSSEIKYYVFCH